MKLGIAAAAVITAISSAFGSEEVIALFTFQDMTVLNNGTSAVTKEASVGITPTLTLVEGGNQALADTNGQNGTGPFYDPDGVSYPDHPSASWTSGLTSAPTQNYFELTTSTKGFHNLKLRFDYRLTSGYGPTGMTLEYAVDDETFHNLDSVSLTRDGNYHSYTNDISVTSLENADEIKIRGTWSSDATGASARIDNLQLTGHFTNGLARVAQYAFTVSNRNDSANYTDINAAVLTSVKSYGQGYSTTDQNTTSGGTHFMASQSVSPTNVLRTSYCEIIVTPVSRKLFEPSLLKFYSRPGSSSQSGTIEATMIVNSTEYSMGTNTVSGTMSPYTFHTPEEIAGTIAASVKYRVYYNMPGGSSLRLDDVEVLGFDKGTLATQGEVVALYPITGNSLADTAGSTQITASSLSFTNHASQFFNSTSTGSASGPPCVAATGFDGDALNRYLWFTLSPEHLTAITPNVVQAYIRTGSGPGMIKAELLNGEDSYSLGEYVITGDMTQYMFLVPDNILNEVESDIEVRLYAWDFDSSGTTFRVDDISVEATLIDLPSPGTIILVQ